MNYASACDGISAVRVAWKPLGWRCVWASEIEPFCNAVCEHHYPGQVNLGDMTKITESDIEQRPAIELLVGGTPCQTFSVAGKRAGLDDPRGVLAFEFLRLAGLARPRWLVWENVPGVLSSNQGEDFAAILGAVEELGYGWAYRILDAQYVRIDGLERAVPQRRRRVFVVGHLGSWRRAAAVLFERACLSGHPAPGREAREGTAAGLTRGADSAGKGGYAGRRREDDENLVGTFQNTGQGWWNESDCAQALRTPDGGGSQEANVVARSLNAKGGAGRSDGDTETFVAGAPQCQARGRCRRLATQVFDQYAEFGVRPQTQTPMCDECAAAIRVHMGNALGVANSLRAEGLDASEDGTGRGTPVIPIDMRQTSRGDKMTNNRPGGSSGGPPGTGIGLGGDPCPSLSETHPPAVAFGIRSAHSHDKARHAAEVGRTRALDTTGGYAPNQGGTVVKSAMAVRRLTPIECARLQGFPDDFLTQVTWRGKCPPADGPQYRALGNAMAVNVMRWIGRRIEMVEAT